MKKKILVVCAACMIVAVAGIDHNQARAESKTIQSYGNLMFRDENQIAVYSSDIQYLKEELDRLFGEIPNG